MSPNELVSLISANAPVNTAPKPNWIQAVDAVGQFIGNAGWPVAVIIALILLREPIRNIKSLGWKEWKVEIGKQLEQAGKLTQHSPTGTLAAPSADEVAKSGEIGRLASSVDVEQVRHTAQQLAAEYERVRASMSPGNDRTRRMEVVVSKMRALGRAVIPLRYELRGAASPGQRLVAIASFQVAPDYESLEWLVERLREEKPFIGYHAAVALVVAARDPRARENLPDLERALESLSEVEKRLPADSDRNATLIEFKDRVRELVGQDAS